MGLNARSKGCRGERQAIDFMKEWTGMDFKRTPGSGGLRGHVLQYSVGDVVLVTPNRILPFVVEVKNYRDLNFQHLLYDVKSDIGSFWEQTLLDAERGIKLPLLLMRYNRLPQQFFFVMIEVSTAKVIFNNRRPRKSFLFGKLLITTTDQLIKSNYRKLEKPLLKLINQRWSQK